MPDQRAKTGLWRWIIRSVLLLLTAAMLVAWRESVVRNVEFLHRGGRVFYMTGGRLEWSEFWWESHAKGAPDWEWHAPLSVALTNWKLEWGRDAGFGYLHLPMWLLAVVTGFLALLPWLPGIRRHVAGLCRRCGYERAGLPASAPCPECGGAAS